MAERAHILVVDDNISLCKSMALVLERNGYAVTVAINGLEAMDRVRERHFDVTSKWNSPLKNRYFALYVSFHRS